MARIVRKGPAAKKTGATNGSDDNGLDHNASMDDINAEYSNTALPEGFTVANAFGVSWDPYKQRVLIGTVDAAGVRIIETPDANKRGKMRWSQKVTIHQENGPALDVWESATLKDWFKRVRPGQVVGIAFKGLLPPKPGKAPTKNFEGGFTEGLPDIREDAAPDDWDGSYNYLTGETPPPTPAPAPRGPVRGKR